MCYALAVHCYGDLINGNGMLRGMEQTLIDLLLDEPAGLLLADRRFAIQAEIAQRTLEAADTLQPECTDMSPRYLVDTFGGRLSFHGCISTAGKVASGTPEETRQEVRDTLDIMIPTNSYMLCSTHELQDNSPTENVVAMYEAAMTHGFYK